MRCETCQSEATVHVEAIGCHFCASCLTKIDARIADMNRPEQRAERLTPAENGVQSTIETCSTCGQTHAEKLTTPFPGTTACRECGWAIDGVCFECGGNHQRTGARTDCIRHWKYRALLAENTILVRKIYK